MRRGGIDRRGRGRRAALAGLVLASAWLAGCAVVGSNQPHNLPMKAAASASAPEAGASANASADASALPAATAQAPEVAVAMSFSGGGLRAAAFAMGAMQGLAAQPGPADRNLLQQVGFITSVSGGSLTAAWVGLNGPDSLAQFRRTALLHAGGRDMRAGVNNSVSLLRLAGDGLTRWLDEEIYHGATFDAMSGAGRPVVWINATNLNRRLPFVFNQRSFDALCSDLGSYRVAEAVAASMAVPLVFSPVVLEKHPEACSVNLPDWVDGDALATGDTMLAKAILGALRDYRDVDAGRYVKLADGGLTDNFGLSSIQQSRLMMGSPLPPLGAAEAMRMRRLLFVVVDGGQRPAVSWSRGIDGPSGLELALASTDAAIEANMRLSYDSFLAQSERWRDDIVRWRCARPDDEQAHQRELRPDWACDDFRISVSRISFDDLGPERARRLHEISTSLTLAPSQVDAVIDAGRDAIAGNAVVQAFSREARPQLVAQ